MADFEVGDTVRASRTGTVTSVTTRWVGVDNGSEFPRNKSWDFEVIEKRKPKVGDLIPTCKLSSFALPIGTVLAPVNPDSGDVLLFKTAAGWMRTSGVAYGEHLILAERRIAFLPE